MELRSLNTSTGQRKANFTPEEDAFIIENYLAIPVRRIAKKLGRSNYGIRYRMKHYNLVVPKELAQQRQVDSLKRTGNTPANKGAQQADYMSAEAIERTKNTRFKKGNIPHNSVGVKNGDIRVRIHRTISSVRKTKWIRVELGKWEQLHRFIWAEIYGPIPEGCLIKFKDGNPLNCSIENLELADMKTNMLSNSILRYPDELQRTMKLLKKLNTTLKNISDGKK